MSEENRVGRHQKPPEQRTDTARCKYTHTEGEIEKHSCWRLSWREEAYCIWHSDDTDAKSLVGLSRARSSKPENLDGAVLKGVDLRPLDARTESEAVGLLAEVREMTDESVEDLDELQPKFDLDLSFNNCSLREVNLSDANLSMVDFTRSDLSGATFSGADVTGASFNQADLSHTDFTNAEMRRADLTAANVTSAVIPSEELQQTRITIQTLANSFSGKQLIDVETPTDDHLTAGELSELLAMVEALYRVGCSTARDYLSNINLNNTKQRRSQLLNRVKKLRQQKEEDFQPATEPELEIRSISKESPLLVTFSALTVPLIFAVIISGGEINYDTKAVTVRVKLPPLGEGLENLANGIEAMREVRKSNSEDSDA